MSTSKPNIAAPPIPKTLDLDAYVGHFFSRAEQSAPVDVRFRLDNPALKDKVFIGRVARFCTGGLHMVAREFSGDPVVDAKAPVLMSALAMPYNVCEHLGRAREMRGYLASHLDYPDPQGHLSWQSRVPTLRGSTVNAGFRRLHLDPNTGLGLQFDAQSCCLVDRRREAEGRRVSVSEGIELGDAIFGWEAPKNPTRAFLEMGADAFHARVEELLDDDSCALYHSVGFHLMDIRERCRHVFDCEGKAHKWAREMLGLALTLELGVGGAFEGWTEAEWQPWVLDGRIRGRGEGGERLRADMPVSLMMWLNIVEEKCECRVREEIWEDHDGLHAFARLWAGTYEVRAERPNAHELVEAWARLKEMREGGEMKRN